MPDPLALRLDDPPAAFSFGVMFGPLPGVDSSWREVSGIAPEMDTETYVEGGEGRYVLTLPKGVKHPRLVLKRGVASIDSLLLHWCKSVLEGGLSQSIATTMVHVFLLDAAGLRLRAWSFSDAWPVKLEVEGFNSTKNEVAIEKIELVYSYSKREL
jgi:phage tail-like protein